MNDIYQYTVPVFIKTLGALKNILEKAETHVKEKNMPESTLLTDAIIFDMFPLTRQIQVSCDGAKLASARLAALEAPKYDDTETTFAELNTRIDTTIAFLQSIPQSSFADAPTRTIELPYYPGKYMTGIEYAHEYVLPNFFFHVTTAYMIIRKNGIAIGKSDFINGLPLKDL
jgi:hypothetical protein